MRPKITKRPWGYFERFTLNELSTVKIITVKPHERLSLQYHDKRAEFWKVLKGTARVTLGETGKVALPGDTFFIKKREAHCLEALDNEVTFLEISFGDFSENDIVRLNV